MKKAKTSGFRILFEVKDLALFTEPARHESRSDKVRFTVDSPRIFGADSAQKDDNGFIVATERGRMGEGKMKKNERDAPKIVGTNGPNVIHYRRVNKRTSESRKTGGWACLY